MRILAATPNTVNAIRKMAKIPVMANRRATGKNIIGGTSANDGYFKAVQSGTNKISIVNGMDESAVNCGYVQCNKLAA